LSAGDRLAATSEALAGSMHAKVPICPYEQMPRGSRPGERRGGRQRGTPNKKTLIKNAVFCAAASDPNRSPLDFVLALMRDPQGPIDVPVRGPACISR
jgi:hypothetical protein